MSESFIRIYNVTRTWISTTNSPFTSIQTITTTASAASITYPAILPAACVGFVLLILTTVLGNTLVLSALFLDKRLHTPSFFLIANMAIADLLLGLSVLPFSSVLEVLNDRWIFGQALCTTWLALDVLCCTASIIALMAVSIDRYIGVTRPLTYSSVMTRRHTLYLILLVWAVSILTSVVPLFGLTDRGMNSKDKYTCKVNKDTFYTIFSSMISFYIPVIILLILYSRVYQEAKKQEKKLETERRRLYEIDYQIASRQRQIQSNGSAKNSIQNDDQKVDGLLTTFNTDEFCRREADELKKQNKNDDETSCSSSTKKKHRRRRLLGKHFYSTIKRTSMPHSITLVGSQHPLESNDEMIILKRKLHNLKREKKAFRTVGLILGALLICWTPFFVTLPLVSILKRNNMITDENTENTWFKITFWLGYCNSALNPFVYAFSNRAIQRAFRQVLCQRFCCFCCKHRKSNNEEFVNGRRRRTKSGSLTTETSQTVSKLNNSLSTDNPRVPMKNTHDLDGSPTDETAALNES